MQENMICPYCSGEMQQGTVESVHAIYWCPTSDRTGVVLPRKKRGAQLISQAKLYFYANAKKCPKCNVIVVNQIE